MKEKVLLAGATGYLGRYIATTLLHESYPTKIIVRNHQNCFSENSSIEKVKAEVTQVESLQGIMKDVDVVISTVGITRQKEGFTYMDVDYRGNLNLLEEAKKAGVKKFIYVSALHADKLKHLKMCNAKERFVDELKQSGMDYCIVRPNGFFRDMTEFLKMARKGKVELFGKGNFKMNPIHGEDLAKVCVSSLNFNDKEIEIGGPEVLSHKEIAELAFETLNKETKISYMPEWLRKVILWFSRTFTSAKSYGPLEFFFTVLAMDMIAPKYGTKTLSQYFKKTAEQY